MSEETQVTKRKGNPNPTLKRDGHGHTYIRLKKTKAYQPGRWPEKKKLEVVTTYLATGSLKITEAMTGVPNETVRWWRQEPWWKDMENEVRSAEDMEMSAQLKKVVDKSLEVVADRLENGDFMYDPKTGKMIRVPVKMRDSHKVMSDVIDKRMLLQKRPTKITEHQTTVDDRLAHLASQFASFVSGKQEEKVIDGEYIQEVSDAVYVEREAQLQEGASVGTQEEAK